MNLRWKMETGNLKPEIGGCPDGSGVETTVQEAGSLF